MPLKNRLCLFIGLLLCIALHAQKDVIATKAEIPSKKVYEKHHPTDSASGSLKPYDSKKNARYKGMQLKSFYLTMRDSVKIAVDLYLPKGLKKGDKIPCIVHQTRYWRRPQLRWPYSMFSNGLIGRTADMIKVFISNGYAIVNVDARGSGASFGYRPHPWTDEETKDGAEILDWVTAQPWSNGKTGSMGISYSGTTAEFLALNHHPSLKAVVLMFSLFDVYEDNAFPGGVHNIWFTSNWGAANALMDANKLPPNAAKFKWLIKGVAPVKKQRKIFKEAVASHANNLNVHQGAMTIDFRDEIPENGAVSSVDAFSPHNFVEKLDASGVAVYSYSGWHDGAYQHAAIKRHINLHNPKNKLIIGPWEHGGAFNISPFTRSKAGFDHAAELLKFFDYHLKDLLNGLYDEPAVHYFTLGADKWQGSKSWPLEKAKRELRYLSGGNNLRNDLEASSGSDLYKEDNKFGTGDLNRWKAVNGKVKTPYTYYDWTERSAALLHYSSEVLPEALEISGHPVITLYTELNSPDAAVFVYLEEVDSSGRVYHVTEGQLRAAHRQIDKKGLYVEAVPQRTHNSAQKALVSPKEVMELKFDLLPISWEFKKGSRIRISISGGDKDLFEIINPDGYEIRVHHGGGFGSVLELPVIEKE